jgi:predicted phage tail protein
MSVIVEDNLQSKQLARVIDLVSEGEIKGLVNGLKSIYLDDTPLQNSDGSFNTDGVLFASRNGTQGQSHLAGFPTIETEAAVGAEVTQATSLTRTVSDTEADAVRVTLSVPRLSSQNTTTGDVSGTSVQIAIDVKPNGGSFVTQKISTEAVNLKYDSGSEVLSSLTQDIVSADITVSWIGETSNFETVAWRVDYRVVGASTWLVLSNQTLSGSGSKKATNPGDRSSEQVFTIFPPNGQRTNSFNPDNEDSYEFRVVKTSGTGTVTLGVTAIASVQSSFAKSITQLGYDTITGKTSSQYQRAYEIPLTGTGPWDIRVRRITDDSAADALQNQTFWDSYTEIISEKFTYPNSALMALSIDSELFGTIPTRGYEIEGIILQVPSNYNALTRIYSGVWDGTFTSAYSNNPAWVFYDLVVNSRYGLGNYVSAALVDKWSLYEIAQYCDEFIDNGQDSTEPRYTINVYIQTRVEAIKLLQALASAFAAMSYWSAGTVTLTQDAPKDPSALFTAGNVINGAFSYAGSSLRTRSTVIGVTWNDPDNLYRQAVEYVEDSVGIEQIGFIKKDVAAFGCTSRGQAHRFGKAILFTERMETETITFSTGLDGLAVEPGFVIQTSDPVRSGDRLGGRLVAASTTAFTLDSSVTIDESDFTLWAVMPDGTVESSTVTTGEGATTTLTVSPAFSDTPEINSIWVLGSTSVNPEKWRVISISEDGANASITALEYRADKYDAIESDIKLDPVLVSNVRTIPAKPSEIVIDESLYLITESVIGIRMFISWLPEKGARYEIEYRPTNGNWIKIESSIPSIDVGPVVEGDNQIKITAISAIGLRSQTAKTTKEILGLRALPADVSSIISTLNKDNITLSWAANADLDLSGYEIRVGGSAWRVGDSFVAEVSATQLIVPPTTAGSTIYRIKAIDTGRRKSENALELTVEVVAPSAPNVSFEIKGPNAIIEWTVPNAAFAVSTYEFSYTHPINGLIPLGSTDATINVFKVDFGGAATFRVRAVDVAGNVGAEGTAIVVISLPVSVPIIPQVIDNNILLRWGDMSNTLPIANHEIRKGATYAAPDDISFVTGTFAALFETESGDYTYWITGIDTAGNYGANSQITAAINQPPDYVFQSDNLDDFSGSKTKVLLDNGRLLAPVNTTETWEEHYVDNGWSTAQDQIDAGLPIYIQPTEVGDSTYERIFDLGALLANLIVNLTVTSLAIDGDPTMTRQLFTSVDGSTYTAHTIDQNQVFVASFRYVKVKLVVTADTTDDLLEISAVRVVVNAKEKKDSGSVIITSTGGTTVTFNKVFFDVASVGADVVIPGSGFAPLSAIASFVDVANPTTMDVFIFNTETGVEQSSGRVDWSVIGV